MADRSERDGDESQEAEKPKRQGKENASRMKREGRKEKEGRMGSGGLGTGDDHF